MRMAFALVAIVAGWWSNPAQAVEATGSKLAEIAIAALECSYLAPTGNEEQRLLALGVSSAHGYISFARDGGEPDFSVPEVGQFTNVIYHSYPSDDFSIGSLYTHLSYSLDEYLEWAKVYSPLHMTHSSGKPATAEFEKRNCSLLR